MKVRMRGAGPGAWVGARNSLVWLAVDAVVVRKPWLSRRRAGLPVRTAITMPRVFTKVQS